MSAQRHGGFLVQVHLLLVNPSFSLTDCFGGSLLRFPMRPGPLEILVVELHRGEEEKQGAFRG